MRREKLIVFLLYRSAGRWCQLAGTWLMQWMFPVRNSRDKEVCRLRTSRSREPACDLSPMKRERLRLDRIKCSVCYISIIYRFILARKFVRGVLLVSAPFEALVEFAICVELAPTNQRIQICLGTKCWVRMIYHLSLIFVELCNGLCPTSQHISLL